MSSGWIAFFAALLGAAVETTEAVTIVLAAGLGAGFRPALRAAAAGVVCLVVVVGAGGVVLTGRIAEGPLRLVVGTLLLLFGMRWLRRAVLRAAGVVPKSDERRRLASVGERVRERGAGAAIAFWGVVVEGLEIVVIVLGLAAGGRTPWYPVAGAATGVVLIVGLGIVLRRPLSEIPENSLKLVVGVVLSSLGTFWVAEGAGLAWPGDIASVPLLAIIFAAAAVLATRLARPAVSG